MAVGMLVVAVAGCFWHRYPRLAVTHAELLAAMAEKGRDLVASGRFTAESLPELTYPYERARAYADEVRARGGATPPGSLVAFDALVARYHDFLDALDRNRRAADPSAAAAALGPLVGDVEAAAEAVKAAVAADAVSAPRTADATAAGPARGA